MGRRINKFQLSKMTISLEEHHDQLEIDLVRLYRKDEINQRYIVLTSNNDHIYPVLRSYFYAEKDVKLEVDEQPTCINSCLRIPKDERRMKLIIISNTLDLRPPYMDINIHSGCALRMFIDGIDENSSTFLHIVYFAIDPHMCTDEEEEYLERIRKDPAKMKRVKIDVYYQNDLKVNPIGKFKEILESSSPPTPDNMRVPEYIGVIFNVESLNVSNPFITQTTMFPGMTNGNFISPIEPNHAFEIARILGGCENVLFMTVSNFNPSKEDLKSGHTIALMIYMFSLNYSINYITL